jgi:hypothetical protein
LRAQGLLDKGEHRKPFEFPPDEGLEVLMYKTMPRMLKDCVPEQGPPPPASS